MDENTYMIIFMVLTGLSAASLLISVMVWTNQNYSSGKAAYGVNRNITKLNTTIANSVNTKLSNFTGSSSNEITNALTTSADQINTALTAQNQNAISIAQGVNQNITKLGIVAQSANAVINQLNSNLTALPIKINQSINKTISRYLANVLTQNKNATVNTIHPWTINQNITAGNYIVYGLPDTFQGYLSFNATNSIAVSLMTIWQFINFSKGTSTSSIATYTSSGIHNTVGFSESESRGCSLYVIVITGNPALTNNITIFPNVTAVYSPDGLTGICKHG